MHSTDEKYMRRCIELASLGSGNTSPNPMVGSVVVHQDKIIGEGWHQAYGGPHAEVHAINNVADKSLLKDSVIYVNLEPCSIHGNTPPCADLIIHHQIPKVVIATLDDHPEVSGNGMRRLVEHGVEVIMGVAETEARDLNKHFFTFHQKQRPYIFLKWAQSRDSYFAPHEGQQWLSNPASQRLSHKWRKGIDAILVGRRTAELDDPALTDRYWDEGQPLRVILDPMNSLPDHLQLFQDGRSNLIFNSEMSDVRGNTEYIQLPSESFDLNEITEALYQRNVLSLMVEGGANVLSQFISEGLWDECVVYHTQSDLHKGIPAPNLKSENDECHQLASNQIKVYYNL